MKLDFDLAKPIYQQIIDEYRRALARGELKPGDKLPSQRELAETVRVNPNTVQRAYLEMERLQLTETLRGQGTFIRQAPALIQQIREEMASSAGTAYITEMKSLGFTTEEIAERIRESLGHGE